MYFLAIIIYRTFLQIEVHSPDEWWVSFYGNDTLATLAVGIARTYQPSKLHFISIWKQQTDFRIQKKFLRKLLFFVFVKSLVSVKMKELKILTILNLYI